ncbi:LAO/AO transport system kinase [Tistlia consotensis]|uniref:LAO/AO transport system kinase n=1 Tax=Tistlia consotensis USBA 355 TaxID=560819 RepID=A0A1Y6B4Q8_9PROT|nr:LAO/AO transport system kinase [Tistlia consotensis USBA 355]SNR25822.1 LAO/AO transport system kinase [Tistlia consotensis]
MALLEAAYAEPRAQVVGLTGPPGVGKSTLTGRLIAAYRGRGETVGVVAVDPSSRRSGGALLGDRLRLRSDAEDAGLFVRSMAARDRLGGLAEITWSAVVLMRALFDRVLVETVGVGQSETDVAGVADTVVFCVQPGGGDSLQFMKAGIVEIPQVAVVTKADMGKVAQRALADLAGALSLAEPEDGWPVRSLGVSAESGEGLAELVATLDAHDAWLKQEGRLGERRHAQAEAWLRAAILERWGREGLRARGLPALAPGQAPFAAAL